jgi:tetratricopeptide (TPR) repeat protein
MFRKAYGRLSLIPFLIAIAGVLPPWCSAQETDTQVQEHFLAAQRDQQQGRLDAAAHEYQVVLRLQPNLAEACVNLGLVYYAQAKFDESAKALAAAGRLKPGMRGVSLWLGIDFVKLRRPEKGVALLREAVRVDPADKLAQSWLGMALWDAGQMDAALSQLRKAVKQFPDDPDLLFATGDAYGKAASQLTEQLIQDSAGTALSDLIYGDMYDGERDWTKAEGHLRRAIERDPKSVEARLKLSQIFLEQTRVVEATEYSEQALALSPRSAAALARSGVLLLLQHREEGLSRIGSALAIDSSEALDALGLPAENRRGHDVPDAKLQALSASVAEGLQAGPTPSLATDAALAALYALAGNQDASQRALRTIGAVFPHPRPSANLLAEAKRAAHDHRYQDAEAKLLLWLAANPGDHLARYELSLARREISMEELAQLLKVAPDSYQVHQMLGQIYARREEDDNALAEYLAVEAARPDLPDVHFWLGHLYWNHGDADHAFSELTRELQLDPAHPEANGELGAVLVAQERAAEAIPHLELAIRGKSDLWPAYTQLGRAYALEKSYARAEEVLKKALSHDHDAATHYQLALALRAEGKTAQAAEVFAQVRKIKNEQMTPLSSAEVATDGAKP